MSYRRRFCYTRETHFKSLLRQLQKDDSRKPPLSQENQEKILKQYENRPSMTFYDIFKTLQQNAQLAIGAGNSYYQIPDILTQLGGPWIKLRDTELARLVLLANRFDSKSPFTRLPVDVARIIARNCIEIKKQLESPYLELTPAQNAIICKQFSDVLGVMDKMTSKRRLTPGYILDRLLLYQGIDYPVPGAARLSLYDADVWRRVSMHIDWH